MEEIADIYYFPREDPHQFSIDETLDKILKRHPVYAYRCDNVFIWCLTATIMVQLWKVIF